jgi:predicted permease
MSRPHLFDALIHDWHFALRGFGRRKGWTTVVVLTLALGIGANTAMFSVVNGMLLHPLPYPDADRVALISIKPHGAMASAFELVPGAEELQAWHSQAHSLEALEVYSPRRASLLQPDGGVDMIQTARITPTFAAFAGPRPLLGRGFSPADTTAGAPRVALLSEHVWRTRFAGSSGVLGTTVTLDDSVYTVVGVMPDALRLPLSPSSPELWLPLNITPDGGPAVARLRPGVTIAQATHELALLRARAHPRSGADASRFSVALSPPRSLVRSGDTLIMLWVAGALVLLIACVNVAHLLLASAATRERELAIRSALGAGRWRLTRQLLTESVLLMAAGCGLGVWLGWLGLREFLALRPAALTGIGTPRLDGTVLMVTIGISAAAALAFGLVGALRLGRRSTQDALQAGASSMSSSRGQHRLRSVLVVAEMALSAILLVGATLLVRSVMHLESIDPGFKPHGLYAVSVTFPRTGAWTPARQVAQETFLSELATRVRAMPGVRAVTTGGRVPPHLSSFGSGSIQAEGNVPIPLGTEFARATDLSPSYFRVLGLSIVHGSTFTDTSATSNQIILNQTAARLLWPGGQAVGQRVKLGGMIAVGPKWREVVGIVADAPVAGLLRSAQRPALYEPRTGRGSGEIIVRTSDDIDPSARLRALIVSMDKHLPPVTITSVEDDMAATMAPVRFNMALLTTFTSIAVLLAAVGLYGVLAYTVAQRTREIGIRIALGATPQTVARVVVRQGVVLAALGGALGLVGAYWGSRLVASLLYGVPRTDPISFAIGAVVLMGTSLIACRVPARRATRVDPIITMRAE